jgi:hypothetical protein
VRELGHAMCAAFLALVPVAFVAGCGARSDLDLPAREFCAEFEARAQPSQLDLFLLLDSSGSMDVQTAQGSTKWQDLVTSFETFLSDASLAGSELGVGFFPRSRPEVPEQCDVDEHCGAPDACQPLTVCQPSTAAGCWTDADCTKAGYPEDRCEVEGGFCNNTVYCDPRAYRIDFTSTLPAAATDVLTSMRARELIGGTPTAPALEGALTSAQAWAQAFPSHKAIVVLATDGLPTTCDPDVHPLDPRLGVGSLPAVAASGAAAGVSTFVIGVFAPDEQDTAEEHLGTVAMSGGTEQAYLISTQANVEMALLSALRDVRDAAARCVYSVDWRGRAAGDATVRLRVESPTAGELVLNERPGRDACGNADGFYFDSAPTGDATVARVALCPATCAPLPDDPPPVDVLVSCE